MTEHGLVEWLTKKADDCERSAKEWVRVDQPWSSEYENQSAGATKAYRDVIRKISEDSE